MTEKSEQLKPCPFCGSNMLWKEPFDEPPYLTCSAECGSYQFLDITNGADWNNAYCWKELEQWKLRAQAAEDVAIKAREFELSMKNPLGGYFPNWTEEGLKKKVKEEIDKRMEELKANSKQKVKGGI